jgi:hypothetical protein
MFLESIVMNYKENCKVEGEILTKYKIAKMYFVGKLKQNSIANHLGCHRNTINQIVLACKKRSFQHNLGKYLKRSHINKEELVNVFSFFRHSSTKPKSNKLSISRGSPEENLILEKFKDTRYGVKRMFNHLKREGLDVKNFTLGKIKGLYKRNRLKCKKIRTFNGERRSLYEYDLISAFEYLQYDVKVIADKHSLPKDIYDKFKYSKKYPKYQWTFIDAKTRTRFLAYSFEISSFFGFKFLEYTVHWIRSHGIQTKINIQMDMGSEFYSGSKKKQKIWNKKLRKYNVHVF